MDESTKKVLLMTLIFFIIGAIVICILVVTESYSREIHTVRSYLSSVFTGLAAFLAILLAVVGIEYNRLDNTTRRLIDSLDTLLQELPISTNLYVDIADYKKGLKDWRDNRYPALLANAKDISAATANGIMNTCLCQRAETLFRKMIVYRRAGRAIGRFQIENNRLKRLPWNVALVFASAGGTVLATGFLLAGLEPLGGNNPALLAIAISISLMVSMVLFFSFVYSIFIRIASEKSQYWFDVSGLEDLKDLDEILKGIAPNFEEFRKKNPPQ
ncbi:MAG: hypothetical protein ACFFB7_03025 [Candidatus Sifarchaeia archaeon]